MLAAAIGALERIVPGLTASVVPSDRLGAVEPHDLADQLRPVPDQAVADLGTTRHQTWWAMDSGSPGSALLLSIRHGSPELLADLLGSLSAQVAVAVDNCAAHAELTHRAHYDALTTMPNRTVFFQRVAAAMDQLAAGHPDPAQRRPGQVTLLVVDLDDFKQVNDTYGHGAGTNCWSRSPTG